MTRQDQAPRRMAAAKPNTFFGGAAILAMGILVVKVIGLFYKIPLVNIIGSEGSADFNNAYNIYSVLLTISTAGLPVAVSKMVSEANALGRQNQVHKVFRLSLAAFLTLGVVSFLIMYFGSEQLAGMMHDSLAAAGIPRAGAGGDLRGLPVRLPGLCPGPREYDAHRGLPDPRSAVQAGHRTGACLLAGAGRPAQPMWPQRGPLPASRWVPSWPWPI